MKKVAVLLVVLMAGLIASAQTYGEWFRQKETQKQYLARQVAALKGYQVYVQKGYALAQEGLSAIGNIKKGDFDLHREYFGSLKQVNPKVSSHAKIAEMMVMYQNIKSTCRNIVSGQQTGDWLSAGEMSYIKDVCASILADCSGIIAALAEIITPGKLEMGDYERLRRLDQLHASMQEAYAFAADFDAGARLLASDRMKAANDLKTSRTLYAIKK